MGDYSQGEVGITELLNGNISDGIDRIHWGACGGEFAARSRRGAQCAGAGAGCGRSGTAAVAGPANATGDFAGFRGFSSAGCGGARGTGRSPGWAALWRVRADGADYG